MEARSRARYQLYRKASLKNVCACFWRRQDGTAGQRRHKAWRRSGSNSLNAKIRECVWVFLFFPWRASMRCLYFTFSLSGMAFRGVGLYLHGRWRLFRWVFGGGGPFYFGRPNPRSCLLLLLNPSALLLISKGKALIQLLLSPCTFHFSFHGTLWCAAHGVRSLGYVAPFLTQLHRNGFDK